MPACSDCYFGQDVTFVTRFNMQVRLCRRSAPSPGVAPGLSIVASGDPAWPTVKDSDWCGDGMDKETMEPYSGQRTYVTENAKSIP